MSPEPERAVALLRRRDFRRAADLVRGGLLIPIAIAGLAGELPLVAPLFAVTDTSVVFAAAALAIPATAIAGLAFATRRAAEARAVA
jgi:hypothetical protein